MGRRAERRAMAETRFGWSSQGVLGGMFLAFAILVGACGGSAGDSVEFKDAEDRALFEVPRDWHIYEADELAQVPFVPFVNPGQYPIVTQVGFDGGAGRAVANLSTESIAAVDFPVGAFSVRAVGTEARDGLSREAMQDLVISDNTFQFGQMLLSEDFDFGRDYEGIRRWIPYIDQTTSQTGLVYFISVTDPNDTTVYTMAAGCSAVCWEQYRDDIIGVVDSWIVNTRQ